MSDHALQHVAHPSLGGCTVVHNVRIDNPFEPLRVAVRPDGQSRTREVEQSHQSENGFSAARAAHRGSSRRSAKSWITPACLASPEWCAWPAAYAPAAGSKGIASVC